MLLCRSGEVVNHKCMHRLYVLRGGIGSQAEEMLSDVRLRAEELVESPACQVLP